MERTTKAQVVRAFENLAKAMGKQYSPATPAWTTREGGGLKATVGVWMLDHNGVYGGYVITEMDNEGGGESNPFGCCRMSAREFVKAANMAARAVSMSK